MADAIHIAGDRWRLVVAGCLPLEEAIGDLREGDNILAITAGRWAILDVAWLALRYVSQGASFIASTWGPTTTEAAKLRGMIRSGDIGSIKIIVDGHGMKLNPKDMLVLEEVVGRDALRMSHVHAKIVVVCGPNGGVVISSSMNWSRNPRVEQFVMAVDRQHAADVFAEYERMWGLSSTEWGAEAARRAYLALTEDQRAEVDRKRKMLRGKAWDMPVLNESGADAFVRRMRMRRQR